MPTTPHPEDSPLWLSATGAFGVSVIGTLVFVIKLGGLWDIIPAAWWSCGVCAMVLLHARAQISIARHAFWDYLLALSLGVITLALLSGGVKSPN